MRFNQRTFNYSRDELRTICRAKGWLTSRDGKFSKERGIEFLEKKGVGMDEVISLIRNLRAASRGASTDQQAGPVTNITQGMDEAAVTALIEARMQGAAINVKHGDIAKMIQEAVNKAQPGKLILNGEDDKKPVSLKHRTHPVFEKVLRLVRAGLNVLLVGPAGCGKTTLAHHIATAMKREYGMLSCTSGASEAQLTGWLLPVGEGKDKGAFTYVASEFVRLYEQGDSVFLLDEFDAADPNMLLVINSALANGAVHIPQRHSKPEVKRGKNVAILAAANTFGTGADAMYAGRNQLDAATLDRFYVVRMDYDAALEADIFGMKAAKAVEAWEPASNGDVEGDLNVLWGWVNDLRESVTTHRLRRVVSTRTFQKAIAARKAGVPVREVKQDILAGWTRDEMVKAGVQS